MSGRFTALVAEDEAPQREALIGMLRELWPELEIAAACGDGLSALEALDAVKPTVAFLDIRMPGVSGVEVARAASGRAHVVFTTAYSEYALKAFDEGAIDYLLKPILRERLAKAVERLKVRLGDGAPDIGALLGTLQQTLGAGRSELKWITANAGDTVKMFAVDDVLFFQAQDKYTRVVTTGDEAHIRTPLKELIVGLDSAVFWQVHRGAIVRAAAIGRVRRDGAGRLSLSVKGRDETLPVSAAFHYRFKAM